MRLTFLLLFGLMTGFLAPGADAAAVFSEQEIEKSFVRDNSEKSIEQRELEKEIRDKSLHGKETKLDKLRRSNLGLHENAPVGKTAVKAVRFFKWSEGEYQVEIVNGSTGNSTALVTDSDFSVLGADIASGELTIYEGDLPSSDSWRKWLKVNSNYVLASDSSSNDTLARKMHAAGLGYRTADLATIAIFNALPKERSRFNSAIERQRMRKSGSGSDWIRVNEDIKNAIDGGARIKEATRSVLLDELESGNEDIMIIFAHSDSDRLYLPGRNGGSISLVELQRKQRSEVPNRIIVLIACDAGTVNRANASFAEVLLKNRLAKSVFAIDDLFDARDIPGILKNLKSGIPMRKALFPLHQIVEYEWRFDCYPPALPARGPLSPFFLELPFCGLLKIQDQELLLGGEGSQPVTPS